MSVRTAADENLEAAKDHINAAIKCLGGIVIDECHGHDGYISAYRLTIGDSLYELIKIREALRT